MTIKTDMNETQPSRFIPAGLRAIAKELAALQTLEQKIGDTFEQACSIMHACKGRVVVLGMGKSGHIGRKIAATLSSTGTPAFFVHPGEANHGDMGMITKGDVVLAISNSGQASEIITLLPLFKRMQLPLISITGQPDSALALAAEVNLDLGRIDEACPMNLAPTTSTTMTLVLGDALAIALLEERGFTKEQFAFSHPGGMLGRRLLLRVEDIMHAQAQVPCVQENVTVLEALSEITNKGFGVTAVVDDQKTLMGVFTDGDLRRTIDKKKDISRIAIKDVMARNPSSVWPSMLAAEALSVMENKKITSLIVVDKQVSPIGIIHMHDMLKAGLA